MAIKKLIDRQKLNDFSNLMKIASNEMKNENDKYILLELINKYEKFILEEDDETINKIKRDVYLKMKAATDPEENKKLYELYSSLKSYTELKK